MSKADLIALAGAKAVAVCGGPAIMVLVGRQDAAAADPTGRMVSEKAGVEALKANFADKGLGVKEMVVLSGAHTLGGHIVAAMVWHFGGGGAEGVGREGSGEGGFAIVCTCHLMCHTLCRQQSQTSGARRSGMLITVLLVKSTALQRHSGTTGHPCHLEHPPQAY